MTEDPAERLRRKVVAGRDVVRPDGAALCRLSPLAELVLDGTTVNRRA